MLKCVLFVLGGEESLIVVLKLFVIWCMMVSFRFELFGLVVVLCWKWLKILLCLVSGMFGLLFVMVSIVCVFCCFMVMLMIGLL